MNRMLAVIFDNENAAYRGCRELHQLHDEGSITLYGLGVIAKDAAGTVSVKDAPGQIPYGTGIGFAVGGLIGMLGGPVGLAVGAVTGSLVGAVRDYWAIGIGLDFVEDAEKFLQPGKVAVIAEVEEEWVIPIDTRMEAAGGVVFRRARTEFADARFAADVTAIKGEVAELEREYTHATGAARERLTATIATTTASLDAARNRAKSRFDELEAEAAGKIRALEQQLAKAKGDVKATLDERIKRVRAAYRERSARLKRAWEVAKEAVAA